MASFFESSGAKYVEMKLCAQMSKYQLIKYCYFSKIKELQTAVLQELRELHCTSYIFYFAEDRLWWKCVLAEVMTGNRILICIIINL
jgi:hypothetical protein